jgi:3alpha(or 20beta)-hydroxysteroid dehydrogenase
MTSQITDYSTLFRLDQKTALVTGGARGIGAEICRALGSVGASVLVADILDQEGEIVADGLRNLGISARYLHLDVTSEEYWNKTIVFVLEAFGGLDVVVNNAGIEAVGFVADTSVDTVRRLLDVNVLGTFLGCRCAIEAMRSGGRAGRGGSIINMSSLSGLVGQAGLGAYNASKGAVRLLTKSVAIEGAKNGIRCNSIHPGLIKTDMGSQVLQKYVDLGVGASFADVEQATLSRIPIGRWGNPEEIAAAAVFLASQASSYMTGSELVVDGGSYAT